MFPVLVPLLIGEVYGWINSFGIIQLGQALSTRPDILPTMYCQELAKLQVCIFPHFYDQEIYILLSFCSISFTVEIFLYM